MEFPAINQFNKKICDSLPSNAAHGLVVFLFLNLLINHGRKVTGQACSAENER